MHPVNDEYRKLIESPRVSSQTQTVLLDRLVPDGLNYEPLVLSPDEFATLRAVLDRVVPQGDCKIDLAAGLDKTLAEAKGDGWRYAILPSDLEAYRIGLKLLSEFSAKLSAVPFFRLSHGAQDSLLNAITCGRLCSPKLDLKLWFEDLRAEATKIYVSHPHTLANIGYSGIADDPNGFVLIGIGQREEWEPKSR